MLQAIRCEAGNKEHYPHSIKRRDIPATGMILMSLFPKQLRRVIPQALFSS